MADHVDIGFARGEMSNGTKWELVVFAQDQHTFANFVMPQAGLEGFGRDDFRQLLVQEGLVSFSETDAHSGSAAPGLNKNGNRIWTIFIVVGDEDGVVSSPSPPLSPMSQYIEDPEFAFGGPIPEEPIAR